MIVYTVGSQLEDLIKEHSMATVRMLAIHLHATYALSSPAVLLPAIEVGIIVVVAMLATSPVPDAADDDDDVHADLLHSTEK